MEQNTALATRTQQTSSLSLAELHPDLQVACRQAATMNSLTAIVGQRAATIGVLQKTASDNDLEKVFRYLLAKLREDLHIDNGFTNDNIRAIARRLRTDDDIRWWLSVADIRLLCQKIKNGEYGKFYGHFSEQEFYNCMIQYCNERTDLHRNQAESNTTKPDPAVLEKVNLGYRLGKDGQLIVENRKPLERKPLRYRYDEKGNIIGENPEYMEKYVNNRFREHQKNHPEATQEELEKINRSNRVMARMRELMQADPTLDYLTAILRATEDEKAILKSTEEEKWEKNK